MKNSLQILRNIFPWFSIAFAALGLAIPAQANTAIQPESKTTGTWMTRHNDMVERASQGPMDIMLLGDSITQLWATRGVDVWESNFGHWEMANFGISADRTQHLLWRLQNGLSDGYQPKVIVLSIGTNNTGFESDGVTIRNTPEEAIEGIEMVVDEIRTRFPETPILFFGLFPRGTPDSLNRIHIIEINESIAQLHDGEWIHYIEVWDPFMDEEGEIDIALMYDRIHMTDAGYEIWADALREPLHSMLSWSSGDSWLGIDVDRLEPTPEALEQILLRRAALESIAATIPNASDYDTIVYIDPSAAQNGNGTSAEAPFDSWTRVTTFRSGTAYLQRAGTSQTLTTRLANGNLPSNILIGAYGEGPRPYLASTDNSTGDRGTIEIPNNTRDVVIRDMHIRAPDLAACINLRWSERAIIFNNELEDSFTGIRGFGGHYQIIGNIIHRTQTNGIYFQDAEELEIAWNFIFRTNTRWEPPYTDEDFASGDGVQFIRALNWHVHHNVIDRSSAGNKFCFISNQNRGTGLLEHNHFIGPRSSNGGGSSVYLGAGFEGSALAMIFRYNTFSTSGVGALWHHHSNLTVYGNLFINSFGGIYNNGNQTRYYHNVFWNPDRRIMQGGGIVVNNIIDNRSAAHDLINLSSSRFNMFTGTPVGHLNFQGNPEFIDPDNLDFRLSPNSDAIDAGTVIEAFPIIEDRLGTPMPQGDAPDVGAFEYFPDVADVPDVPSGLTTQAGHGEILLTWEPVSTATGYEVWRALSASGDFTLVGSVATHQFSDIQLINDQPYYYRVVATNATGSSLFSTIVSGTPVPPPSHWNGFVIDADGWVNTSSWFGPAWVNRAPWVYVLDLTGWHYVSEDTVDEDHFWVFSPRLVTASD